ncbi:hypothetical protein BDV10DRAFT_185424 [Aspergillus recurvatus]
MPTGSPYSLTTGLPPPTLAIQMWSPFGLNSTGGAASCSSIRCTQSIRDPSTQSSHTQSAIDYPHETTRTAMDMIVNGTRFKYPACKFILSHAGGAIPYLISRVTTPMKKASDFAVSHRMGTTYDESMEAFRSFHSDLAGDIASADALHHPGRGTDAWVEWKHGNWRS